MRQNWRLSSLRPLVRYVDEHQAVVETQFAAHASMTGAADTLPVQAGDAQVFVQITGSDGFHDESRFPLQLAQKQGCIRLEIVQPQRWWPAGMGDQPLYELNVTLVSQDEVVEQRTLTLGLTSVRRPSTQKTLLDEATLLINGQIYQVESLIAVDRTDESQLLPAGGDTLLLVRDHYGPDVLYQAADRAGILLIQCLPIHPAAALEQEFAQQIDRLAAHPSLAGWFVGHLGSASDTVAQYIKQLDPTRYVFRELPMTPAA